MKFEYMNIYLVLLITCKFMLMQERLEECMQIEWGGNDGFWGCQGFILRFSIFCSQLQVYLQKI